MNDKLPRDEDGKLSAYAWPGGYDIMYLDHDNSVLCVDCARQSEEDKDDLPRFAPCDWFILNEGEEWCNECNAHFGEPIEDEENSGCEYCNNGKLWSNDLGEYVTCPECNND